MCRISYKTHGGADYFTEMIPDDVADDMNDAEADVIEPIIRRNAATMLSGPYSTRLSSERLERRPPSKGKDGERRLVLTWRETRDYYMDGGVRKSRNETRDGEIAFINEYGARGIPARGFIQAAIDEGEKKAHEASEQIFRSWEDNKL